MDQKILQGMVHHLGCDNYQVGLLIKMFEILARIVTRLVNAARVEKSHQRRFRRWKVIEPRKPCAGLEALPYLRLIGTSEEFDKRSLAALGFPIKPKHRHRCLAPDCVELLVKLPVVADVPGKPAFDLVEHRAK